MAIKSKSIESVDNTPAKNPGLFAGVLSTLSMFGFIFFSASIFLFLMNSVLNENQREEYGALLHLLQNPQEAPNETYKAYLFIGSLAALYLLSAALAFGPRKSRRRFEEILAVFLGKIWVEIKLLFFIVPLIFFYQLTLLAYIVIYVYLLCLDIGYNRRFFSQNIIHSLLNIFNSAKKDGNFEKKTLRRFYSCIAVCFGTPVLIILLWLWMWKIMHWEIPVVIAVLICISEMLSSLLWYCVSLRQSMKDLSDLQLQIKKMYDGDLNAANLVPTKSDLYDSAMQLSMIKTGLQNTVEESIRADKMKIELVTNVSHDIKTPLTSIITYSGLLKKAEGLPDYAIDYINIIFDKSKRLNDIVQDLFELSKASTGNINLNISELDLAKLIRQTCVEMSDVIDNSPFDWKLSLPDTPVLVRTDGQRIYRVLQNLIRNCAQYSLEKSRIYLTLTALNGSAVVTMRNISKEPLGGDSESLVERFTRGDKNRSTEGSGLGLSIAKSFTEACGGTFSLKTEGDLFTVTLKFDTI